MGDLEKLSSIHWKDAAAIETAIMQKILKLFASDQAYQNARKHSDPENIRIEAELAVQRAISAIPRAGRWRNRELLRRADTSAKSLAWLHDTVEEPQNQINHDRQA